MKYYIKVIIRYQENITKEVNHQLDLKEYIMKKN